MLKEFFLVDYKSINSFKEISTPLFEIATESFLLIAAIFELLKGLVGKSNVESRVTIFILAAISITAFNQYNQKILDVSFETSDKILSKLHISSMTKISDIMKSSPAKEIEKSNQNHKISRPKNETINEAGNKGKVKPEGTTSILSEARIFMANNIAIALAWLISVIAIGLSRILFTVIYYTLVVMAPIIIFISVFPGYESSLKAFWPAFVWCFLAPIVFSVIFVLMHLIAQKENQSGTGLESLINVLLYGIFLVGSFIMTYKISTSQPMTAFAEHASMIGAMTMATPFTSASGLAQSAMHSPFQTYDMARGSLGRMNRGVAKLSRGNIPGNGVGDISRMNRFEVEKKFGKTNSARIYSEQAFDNDHGNKMGVNSPEQLHGRSLGNLSEHSLGKSHANPPDKSPDNLFKNSPNSAEKSSAKLAGNLQAGSKTVPVKLENRGGGRYQNTHIKDGLDIRTSQGMNPLASSSSLLNENSDGDSSRRGESLDKSLAKNFLAKNFDQDLDTRLDQSAKKDKAWQPKKLQGPHGVQKDELKNRVWVSKKLNRPDARWPRNNEDRIS